MVKNKLKEIRMKEFIMNSGEFANYLGMSVKTYSGWENGNSRPTLEKALELSTKLNRDVKEIWYLE